MSFPDSKGRRQKNYIKEPLSQQASFQDPTQNQNFSYEVTSEEDDDYMQENYNMENVYTFQNNNPKSNTNQPSSQYNHFQFASKTFSSEQREFTMGQPFSTKSTNTIDYNNFSGFPHSSTVVSSPHYIMQYQKQGQPLSSQRTKSASNPKFISGPSVRDSQEIRIEALENIISDKIKLINDLEMKLQQNRMKSIATSEQQHESHRSLVTLQEFSSQSKPMNTQKSTNNLDQVEKLYKQTLSKKNKYKERAKRYKGITEINSIKDDLSSQIRKEQIEYQYEKERYEKELFDKQQYNAELKGQLEFYKKESEKYQNEQVNKVLSIKREYECIIEEKDRLNERIKDELKLRDREINTLLSTLKESDNIKRDIEFYEEELEKYRSLLLRNEDLLSEKDQINDSLKQQIQQLNEQIKQDQQRITEQDQEIRNIRDQSQVEVRNIREQLQQEIKHIKEKCSQEMQELQDQLQYKTYDKDRELRKLDLEIERLREDNNDLINNQKKLQIKYEREILEQETQIKTLTMIIDEIKQQTRDKVGIEQRLEGKNKEIKILKDEIEQMKEDLLCYRLNLVKKPNVDESVMEKELIKLTQENKNLKIEINELKHKFEDAQFKSNRQNAKTQKDLENENSLLKEAVVKSEKRVYEQQQKLRSLEEEKQRQSQKQDSQLFQREDKQKLQSRITELEQYCEDLHSQLSKWAKMDKQSQLLINKLEAEKITNNKGTQNEKQHILVQ